MVFPAPAGINRDNTEPTGKNLRVPRASGDKPVGPFVLGASDRCSPRQRG